jgi:hypothetical protein
MLYIGSGVTQKARSEKKGEANLSKHQILICWTSQMHVPCEIQDGNTLFAGLSKVLVMGGGCLGGNLGQNLHEKTRFPVTRLGGGRFATYGLKE